MLKMNQKEVSELLLMVTSQLADGPTRRRQLADGPTRRRQLADV